jgi:soluble lytic murein transglycosylase-like protein
MAGVTKTWDGKLLTSLKMLINKAVPVVLAALCVALAPASASAQIYSWRDANGHLVVGNTPRSTAGQGAGEIVPSYPVPKSDAIRATRPATSDRVRMYEGLITEHARLNDVRPDLVRAVVQVESAYNPYARSPKGAVGLMQLMPATAQLFGVKNAFSPEQNIRAGVAYLRQLLNRYENNEELALAAYNAGPNAVAKYGETVPPYAETKKYVSRINGIATPPIQRRDSNRIYKVTEIVNGRQVVRYTDKRPAGSYTVLGR